MANDLVLLDTSILIDYFRKTDKNNSIWISLIHQDFQFAISVVTKFEIYAGAGTKQIEFWDNVFEKISVIPFDELCTNTAVKINENLKKKRKQIGIADLFIAATALTHNIPMATINKKHFERVHELIILD